MVVVAFFAPVLLRQDSWMMQLGAALIILATAFVAWQMHRRTATGAVPEAGEALRDYHRQTLIRQRDALRSLGWWYMAPFAPGMALLMMGRWFQGPHARPVAGHGPPGHPAGQRVRGPGVRRDPVAEPGGGRDGFQREINKL